MCAMLPARGGLPARGDLCFLTFRPTEVVGISSSSPRVLCMHVVRDKTSLTLFWMFRSVVTSSVNPQESPPLEFLSALQSSAPLRLNFLPPENRFYVLSPQVAEKAESRRMRGGGSCWRRHRPGGSDCGWLVWSGCQIASITIQSCRMGAICSLFVIWILNLMNYDWLNYAFRTGCPLISRICGDRCDTLIYMSGSV